jgi:hypothetical protein
MAAVLEKEEDTKIRRRRYPIWQKVDHYLRCETVLPSYFPVELISYLVEFMIHDRVEWNHPRLKGPHFYRDATTVRWLLPTNEINFQGTCESWGKYPLATSDCQWNLLLTPLAGVDDRALPGDRIEPKFEVGIGRPLDLSKDRLRASPMLPDQDFEEFAVFNAQSHFTHQQRSTILTDWIYRGGNKQKTLSKLPTGQDDWIWTFTVPRRISISCVQQSPTKATITMTVASNCYGEKSVTALLEDTTLDHFYPFLRIYCRNQQRQGIMSAIISSSSAFVF